MKTVSTTYRVPINYLWGPRRFSEGKEEWNMDVCIYLPTCTQQFIYHLPFAFTEIWIGPQHIQATLYIFCCFPLSYYWCTRLFNNTNWTRPAPTRQRVRRQTWRFYPGGLNVKCIMLFIFSISSEGGNRIKERLFAGSMRRRRRSETMREMRPWPAAPRWTWEGRAAAEARLCWCSMGFLRRCNCDLSTILIFPVSEMMF